jgi:hypothetical protein
MASTAGGGSSGGSSSVKTKIPRELRKSSKPAPF